MLLWPQWTYSKSHSCSRGQQIKPCVLLEAEVRLELQPRTCASEGGKDHWVCTTGGKSTMNLKQVVPSSPEQHKPQDFAPNEELQKSTISEAIDEALAQGEEYYTCAHRFKRFSEKTHMEGICMCTMFLPSRVTTDKSRLVWPIRCDKSGNPLPGATPEFNKEGRR